ncbi:ribonuclease H [Sesbania bispinosa]|nr:ribonuclease H [Sesbania bispinosa]
MDWEVEIHHILREGNACADLLAKQGAKVNHHLQVLNLPPPELSSALIADAVGIRFIRR